MENFLKRKKNGALAFEYILEFPVIVATLMATFYFMMICLTYISLNNTANNLAQDFNMRQSGYSDTQLSNDPKIRQVASGQYNPGNLPGAEEIKNNDGTISLLSPLNWAFSGTHNGKNNTKIAKIFINGEDSNSKDLPTNLKKIKGASYYFINERRDALERLPGVSVTRVEISLRKNGTSINDNNLKNASMMGTKIQTTIQYKVFGFKLEATGYNIIC